MSEKVTCALCHEEGESANCARIPVGPNEALYIHDTCGSRAVESEMKRKEALKALRQELSIVQHDQVNYEMGGGMGLGFSTHIRFIERFIKTLESLGVE